MRDYIEGQVFEKEELTFNDRYNEYVMTSLRTMWGIDLEYIRKNFGDEYAKKAKNILKRYVLEGKIYKKDEKYALNDNGMLFADGIAAELFT